MSSSLPQFLIIGLGNVGARYTQTRHNIGFMAVDQLAERLNLEFRPGAGDYYIASNLAQDRPKSSGRSWWSRIFGKNPKNLNHDPQMPVVLIKPTTLMNRSGAAARQALERYQLSPERMLIITDDFQLPLGALRLRAKGSDGGHNGLKSLIAELNTAEFPRIRLGIGPAPEKKEIISFVLGDFDSSEHGTVQQVTGNASEACEFLLDSRLSNSLDLAAAKYNIVRPDPAPGSGCKD